LTEPTGYPRFGACATVVVVDGAGVVVVTTGTVVVVVGVGPLVVVVDATVVVVVGVGPLVVDDDPVVDDSEVVLDDGLVVVVVGALRRYLNGVSAALVCAATEVEKLLATAVAPTYVRVDAEASIVTIVTSTEEATASVTSFGNRWVVFPLRNWISVPLFMVPNSQPQNTSQPTDSQQLPNFFSGRSALTLPGNHWM